jgi:hypothetical protein
MSINNLDYTSYNYLTNLATVNANEVNTDVLTKSDPDISDLQFDMLEGINTNETIQQQIDGIIAGLETVGYWGAFWSNVDQTNAGATPYGHGLSARPGGQVGAAQRDPVTDLHLGPASGVSRGAVFGDLVQSLV